MPPACQQTVFSLAFLKSNDGILLFEGSRRKFFNDWERASVPKSPPHSFSTLEKQKPTPLPPVPVRLSYWELASVTLKPWLSWRAWERVGEGEHPPQDGPQFLLKD